MKNRPQKYFLFFGLFASIILLNNCHQNKEETIAKRNKAVLEDKNTVIIRKTDASKPKHLYIILLDTVLNNKHVQLIVDSIGGSDLFLKVNEIFADTTMMNIDNNTFYPSTNIYTFEDNYGKRPLKLRRTFLYKHYFYITFDNIGMHRQMIIIDINKMRFLNGGLDTYLLAFIVDGDKIITCYEHPDPTNQYSRKPFEISQVMNGKISAWRKFSYNIPSVVVGNNDSMVSFMHELLRYYKVKYK